MNNWKITIEGSGPCLDSSCDAADEGAKHLVDALKRRGHEISRAEFAGNGKIAKDINVEPTPPAREPMGDTAAYEKGFSDAKDKLANDAQASDDTTDAQSSDDTTETQADNGGAE